MLPEELPLPEELLLPEALLLPTETSFPAISARFEPSPACAFARSACIAAIRASSIFSIRLIPSAFMNSPQAAKRSRMPVISEAISLATPMDELI